ncbi:hypothetical protein ACTA71_005062 [Dictyostelium dimigraforme]
MKIEIKELYEQQQQQKLEQQQQFELQQQKLEHQQQQQSEQKQLIVEEKVIQTSLLQSTPIIIEEKVIHKCEVLNDEKDLAILRCVNKLLGKEITSGYGLLFCELINKFIPESIDSRGLFKVCKSKQDRIDNNTNNSNNNISPRTQLLNNTTTLFSSNGLEEIFGQPPSLPNSLKVIQDFQQTVDAIIYLHNEIGIIHFDLKPSNVLKFKKSI